MIDFFWFLLIAFVVIPISVYISAKLGAYGYLVGKRKYEQDQLRSCPDGNKETESESRAT